MNPADHVIHPGALLQGRLDEIDTEKAVDFVLSCENFDGGFGCRPGSETHSGQVTQCFFSFHVLKQFQASEALKRGHGRLFDCRFTAAWVCYRY